MGQPWLKIFSDETVARPALFQVTLAADQTGIVTATWTKILWDVENINEEISETLADGFFQPKTTGWYLIGCQTGWKNSTTGNRRVVIKSDVQGEICGEHQGTAVQFSMASMVALVNITSVPQEIHVQVYHNTGVNEYFESSKGASFWAIKLI